MFNLNSWVHLDEDVLASVWTRSFDQKLNGASVLVTDLLGKGDRVHKQLLAQSVIKLWRWRNLNNLLVSALNRAVPFVQVDDVAVQIGQNLDLNVPWPNYCLL